MNPRIAANQQRHFLGFLAALRPHVARDTALPRRIKEMLASQRALGSRDRRLYRELLFTALRYWPWIEPMLEPAPETAARVTAWLAADLKDTQAFRAATCGDWPPPPPAVAGRAAFLGKSFPDFTFSPPVLLPTWFQSHCPQAFNPPNLDFLLQRAPLWVRLQTENHALVFDEFKARGWTWEPAPGLTDAFRISANADVGGTDAYRRGFVEIQDLGSQLLLHHANITPGEHWLDACAGAGGKTLQLARIVGDRGTVDATDIRPEALAELRERVVRARLTNVQLPAQPGGNYDGILIDAPCSGSGTWRRSPHLKWSTTAETVTRHAQLQGGLLREHARRIRPGGQMVYATCSLSRMENHDVVASFLKEVPKFAAERPARDWQGEFDGLGTTLLPATHDTDGFYVSILRHAG